jgi:hypothetical protein
MITCGIFYTFTLFYALFYCTPRSFIWNKLQNGTCMASAKKGIVSLFTASINIALDVAMLLLPTASLWKVHIDRKRKIQITCLFGLGIS